MIKFRGHLYRAAVEVDYEALGPDAQYLVDLWLSKSGKKPGTPEYEQFKQRMIERALQFGERTDVNQRVNASGHQKTNE